MWALALLSKLGPLLMGPVTQFVTGINLSEVWSNVVAFLKLLIKNWQITLIALLAIATAFNGYMWKTDHTALVAERASHQKDIQSYKDAQADATKKVEAEKQQVIKESKIKADATDKQYHDLLDQYNASLLRFKTSQGPSGGPSNQGDNPAGQASSSLNGPGSDTDILISLGDAHICATNTARLQAAHDWAINLGKPVNGDN